MHGQMDVWMGRTDSPCILQDFVPSGLLPNKRRSFYEQEAVGEYELVRKDVAILKHN